MPTNAASWATAPRMRSASATQRGFGVRQLVASLIEPSLQDQLRGDRVARAARPRAAARVASSADCGELRRVPLVRAFAPAGPNAALELAARSAARARSSRAACRPRAPECRRPAPAAATRPPASRWRRSASSSRAGGDRRHRLRAARERIADGDADPPRAEIERKHGDGGRRMRGHASRVPDVLGQPREVDAEQLHRRGQSLLGGQRRTAGSASASTVSQAFCASSCSSWPADQPA